MIGDDVPRADKTEEEIRALLDDVIERIASTCEQLSACAYMTDDSVEEVQRKLWDSKVCSPGNCFAKGKGFNCQHERFSILWK